MHDTISREEMEKLKIGFLHFCDRVVNIQRFLVSIQQLKYNNCDSSRNKLDNDGQNFTFLIK